jgi:PAS domain S-box-containing protein
MRFDCHSENVRGSVKPLCGICEILRASLRCLGGRTCSSIMRLEELIAEFAARVAPCPLERIDTEIERGMGEILALLHASRICWYVARRGATNLARVYSVSSPGASPSPIVITPDDLPYTLERLSRGQSVAVTRLSDLPPAAHRDREVFERHSVKSVAFIPSSCQTVDNGVLKLTFSVERGWPTELINHLNLLGNFIVATVERKIAQEGREESERLFRDLFEEASLGVALEDLDGRLLHVNPAFCSMVGYTAEELMTLRCAQFSHPDDSVVDSALFEKLRDGMLPRYQMEKRFIRKDGARIWGRLHVSLRDRDHGQSPVVIAMVEDITERKAAEEALTKAQGELQQLTSRLIRAQEDERRRISRELHDDVGQRLALLAVELDTLRQSLAASRLDVESQQASALRQRVEELASDVHQLSHELHSTKLRHLGLDAALRDLCGQVSAQFPIAIDLSCDPRANTLPLEVAVCLFRVTQEALTNVTRHSEARDAAVAVTNDQGLVRLSIRDSGVGFAPSDQSSGLGLVSMRERLRIVGGRLHVKSRPNEGTEVTAEVLLSHAASAMET